MKTVRQRGRFYRVCDPTWTNCCDGTFAKQFGGRWNPPNSFEVLYLNADIETARANAALNYEGEAFGLFDLNPTQRPHLQIVTVAPCDAADAISDDGRAQLGLPAKPAAHKGWAACQKVGAAAHAAGLAGVACRSAGCLKGAEFAAFDLRLIAPGERQTFDVWFFSGETSS